MMRSQVNQVQSQYYYQAPVQQYYAPAPRGLRIEKKFGGLVLKLGRKYRLWSAWSSKYLKPSAFIIQIIKLALLFQVFVIFIAPFVAYNKPVLGDKLYNCRINSDGKVVWEFENVDAFHKIVKPGSNIVCYDERFGQESYLFVNEQLYHELVTMVEQGEYNSMQGGQGILVLEFHL